MESIITHVAVIVALIIVFLPTIAVYCLPTFIAVFRKHPNRRAIIWVNMLLGWSLIGWIVTMIWALTTVEDAPR